MPVLPTGRVPEVREGAGEPAGGRRGAAGRGLPAQEPNHPAGRQGEYQCSIIINEYCYSQTKVKNEPRWTGAERRKILVPRVLGASLHISHIKCQLRDRNRGS